MNTLPALLLLQVQAYDPRQDILYRAYLWFTVLGVLGAFVGLWVISRQTKVAAQAADAARLSAQAVINAERAWITVTIKWQQNVKAVFNVDSTLSGNTLTPFITCVCKNDGNTPAWITEKGICLKLVNVIPKEPDFSEIDIFQHEMQPIGAGQDDSGYRLEKSCAGTQEDRLKSTFLVYGRIRYRTIFDNAAETRFGYVITPMSNLERLPAEYPEYNKNL